MPRASQSSAINLTKSIQTYSKNSHDSTASIACQLYLPPPQPCLTPEPRLPDTSIQTLWLHRPPPSPRPRSMNPALIHFWECVYFLVRISVVYIWKVSPTVFSWLTEAKENARCSGDQSWNPPWIWSFLMYLCIVYMPIKPLRTRSAPYFNYREGMRMSPFLQNSPDTIYCRVHH